MFVTAMSQEIYVHVDDCTFHNIIDIIHALNKQIETHYFVYSTNCFTLNNHIFNKARC